MAAPVFTFLVFLMTLLAIANGQECGQIKVTAALSVGSEYAVRGQWPWFVPLFDNANDKYFCGSTIVSENYLLTGELTVIDCCCR
jgi:secreted trypsin-like serine protease